MTVFMNISAYSCAGYSDPFILEISEGSSGGSCHSNGRLKCEPVEMAEVQHVNFPSLDYAYVQVPVVDRQLSSSQQNVTSQYSMIVRSDLPTPSQEVIGYAEIHLHASTI
jgi:hypothetical protein